MSTSLPEPAPFARLGPSGASTPLVIAVPHAGRCYPPAMLAAARLPRHALETIEDRYADLLISDAVAMGAVAIVASTARAFVDLNRGEREIDPAILAEPMVAGPLNWSAKAAGGLGVIPSRIAAGGAVWRRPLTSDEVRARIESTHRRYHAAIAAALDDALTTHGTAVLLDCHSMPPLGRGHPQVVIGDRYGASAAPHFALAAMRVVESLKLRGARNQPYPGGFTLEHHGQPRLGCHALQIELDRSLYLDRSLRHPGDGLAAARHLVGSVSAALIAAASDHGFAEAAE